MKATARPQAGPAQGPAAHRQAKALRSGDAVTAVLVPGCSAALLWAGWLIGREYWTGSGQPVHSYPRLLGLVAAAAGLAVLLWWVLGLLLAVAGALLHRAGHTRLAAFSFAASPAFLRRLAVAVAGVQLLAAPA
ncbi:hypothetical protein ACFQ36_11610, partial [Arthrobacter sp. GCM10027362]